MNKDTNVLVFTINGIIQSPQPLQYVTNYIMSKIGTQYFGYKFIL